MNTVRSVLISGATGVLGARIILDLIENTNIKIYGLVRAKSEAEAFDRLLGAVRVYADGSIEESLRDRAIAIPGNAEAAGWGINPATLKGLDVDLVIHSAASVNLVALYPMLRKPNVVATDNAVQIALNLGVPLVYVSTHGIQGMKAFEPGFVFRETDFNVGQEFRHFYYAKSKFDAESIVRNYRDRGLEALIVRPGDIFGDSKTGAYPLATRHGADVFYDIFKTAVDIGITAFKDDNFDITPVDYVARAIVALMLDRDCFGKTFHLTNPDRAKYYEVMNLLVDYGYRLRFIEYSEYLDKFRKGKVLRSGTKYKSNFVSLMQYFENFFRGESICATFDTSYTESILRRKGVSCARVDFDLIKTYMDYAIGIGYISAPGDQVLADYGQRSSQPAPHRLLRRTRLRRV